MKKIIFLIASILLMACSQEEAMKIADNDLQSTTNHRFQKVSVEQAKQRLHQFMNSCGRQTRSTDPEVAEVFTLKVSLSDSTGSGDVGNVDTIGVDPNYPIQPEDAELLEYAYVFNFTEDGFAIMGAIEELPEVIAFSDDGYIPDPEKQVTETSSCHNPMVTDYLQELAFYAAYVISNSVNDDGSDPIKTKTYGPWSEGRYIESGLCPVQWHQRSPYNKLFPQGEKGKQPVGCITAAVAQYMACFKYPASYNGYSFDWDAMINSGGILDHYVDTESMIAQLMYQLSRPNNLNIIYNPATDESEGYIKDIPRTMQKFGYSNKGKNYLYTEDAVRNQLQNGFPVIMGGYRPKEDNPTETEGHAWLVDGLYEKSREVTITLKSGYKYTITEYSYLYRCNWGWTDDFIGATYNGWFVAGNFDPRQKVDPKNSDISTDVASISRFDSIQTFYGARP